MVVNNISYVIHTYDDGNQKYKQFPNEWRIVDMMFNGDKVKLQNKKLQNIFINSISTWKIIRLV